MALPVLPVQSHLLLEPQLVMGWEMLRTVGSDSAGICSFRPWWGWGSALTPLHPQILPTPQSNPFCSFSEETHSGENRCLPFQPQRRTAIIKLRSQHRVPARGRRQTVLWALTLPVPGAGPQDTVPPPGWLGSILCPPGAWGLRVGRQHPAPPGSSLAGPQHAAEVHTVPHSSWAASAP